MEETDRTICLNSKVDGKQPSIEHRIYDVGGGKYGNHLQLPTEYRRANDSGNARKKSRQSKRERQKQRKV